ncbi:MAG: response regulator [Thermodesulfobacteriota bacterium]|nr:response regulator [Thermodesulfobacteriota bacterium]
MDEQTEKTVSNMKITSRKPVHILIVDDEEPIRSMLKQGLEYAGYECSIAGDGQEALEILAERDVTVVITDILMPRLDGIKLTKIIKEKYDSNVIVMTGFGEGLKYEEVIKGGASDFIQKPLGFKELLIRLERVLERSRVEEKLRQSLIKFKRVLEATVNALASALEKRDPYTAGHQRRVTSLAYAMAKDMNLSEKQIEGIRIAGLLHDIGKISVPTDILNKPGRLSEAEFNLIKEHPRNGYEILADIEFEEPIAQIVFQHHERMDGSGYPQGLADGEIILEARILAVADVVEAIASHRPYRPALGIDIALDEISKNKGVIYDPQVVDTCLNLFNGMDFQFE